MFCVQCGTQMPDGNKFCPKCGSAAAASGQDPVSSTSEKPVTQAAPTKSSQNKAPSIDEKNYYEILEITRAADIDEIQAAIKKQRTLWSSRVPRGGSMGERARQIVEIIGLAEDILLDDQKRSLYDESLKDKQDYQVVIPTGEKNWLEVLYSYYDQQDWDMAAEAADRATKQQPDNPEAWFLAANVFLNLENYGKANKAAQQVLLLEPDNPTAYGIRGDVFLMDKGDARKALEMYNKMKALAEEDSTRKLAQEAITATHASLAGLGIDSILAGIPQEFEYDKAIMNTLKSSLEKVSGVRQKIEAEYAAVTDPSPWLQGLKAEDMKDCDTVSAEIQRLIDQGNAPVLLPGFWLNVVLMSICALIGFGIMSMDVGIGFGFMAIFCGGFAIRAFYFCRKPAWKANSAFMYKFLR